MTSPAGVLAEVLEAHGGLERWGEVKAVRARVRSGGLLLRSRGQTRTGAELEATVSTKEPRAILAPAAWQGRTGVLERGPGGEVVRLESPAGEVLEERPNPRAAFGFRTNVRWDDLHFTYFAGYALWSYLTTPFLFAREGFETEEIEPWTERGGSWRRLRVTFPPDVPAHSREQVYYFDDGGMLRRFDYTAEVVGGWAKAAHQCFEPKAVEGLVFHTRRKVVPRGPGNRALPLPTIVSIRIDDIRLER